MDINEVQGAVHEIEMMVLVLLDAVVVTLQAPETNPNVFEVSRAAGEMISQSNPDCLGIPENRPQFVLTNRSGATRSADDGVVVTGPRDDARMELCGAGFAFSRSGDLCLFSGFRRNQSRVDGRCGGSVAA